MRIDVDRQHVHEALTRYLEDAPANEPAAAIEAARRYGILPIWNDWVGCMALRPDGELVFVTWDEPDCVERVPDTAQDRRMVHAARAQGAQRFPEIAGLEPTRPANAEVCRGCEGTGRLAGMPENIVCACGGLGWLPPA